MGGAICRSFSFRSFLSGSTHITLPLAFECREGRVTYFHGQLAVFVHAEDDARTFRMITSQFVVNGNATQAEIARAFGVTAISVKRAVQTYRRQGPGGFYVDGHVRVYNGAQTALARHYVSRQRLCLRATADYWVNALDGQPFFVVTKEVDPGLLQTLEHDIVPRLEQDAPALVSAAELATEPLRHRFVLVFDREGYSPECWWRMRQRGIACLTYNKYPGPNWPEEEFTVHVVKAAGGETIEMKLAEGGTDAGPLWVREIRRLGPGGHQTSILATDYVSELLPIAVAMFATGGGGKTSSATCENTIGWID